MVELCSGISSQHFSSRVSAQLQVMSLDCPFKLRLKGVGILPGRPAGIHALILINIFSLLPLLFWNILGSPVLNVVSCQFGDTSSTSLSIAFPIGLTKSAKYLVLVANFETWYACSKKWKACISRRVSMNLQR